MITELLEILEGELNECLLVGHGLAVCGHLLLLFPQVRQNREELQSETCDVWHLTMASSRVWSRASPLLGLL